MLTYTAYDQGKTNTARLCVATTTDLINWTKQGLAFKSFKNGKYNDKWTKSGAIITEFVNGTQMAKLINGKYWMYFGDTNLFIATSDDLINWSPLENETEELQSVLLTRTGMFDS